MKIGVFTDGYLPQINGVATSTGELVRSLRMRKNKVVVVAPKFPKYKDKDKDILRLKSIKVYRNPEIRLAYMFPDKILRQVVSQNFDVIHGFAGGVIPSLGLALAKIKNKPYVFTYNTRFNKYTHYILNGKIVKPGAVEKAMAVFCNRCDSIVAPANFIKKELVGFGVKKPIYVIPNGIDTKKFSPKNKNYLRNTLGLNKEDKIVLYLGRLAKEKSVDFIFKVFKNLSLQNKDCYLVVAGDGPQKLKLERLCDKLGIKEKVIFLGFVDFELVPKIYSGSDVFVFASQTETQGMVVLEAMACGLPVVVAKDKVFDEVIENKKEGFTVYKKQAEFVKALEKLLRNGKLRKEISKNARKKTEEFSLEKIALEFEDLYKNLI